MSLDPRILNRCSGFWPNAQLTREAVKAWEHLLARFDPQHVLDALDDYAAEGHPRPPVAGQLCARIKPSSDARPRETEAQRCRRQRADAERKIKAGKMARADFDHYEQTYWSLHA